MIAASALVVAVLASYAGIGMLSLTASTSLPAFTSLPGVEQVVTGIGWNKPDLRKYVHVGKNVASSAQGVLSDISLIAFNTVGSGGGNQQVSIANTSSAPLALTVRAYGANGVNATFQSGGQNATVRPGKAATVNVTSSASYAGPFTATLHISAKGLTSINVPITGVQAPLPPGAVTATPAAGGAVDLSWAPSQSVSGVSGYIVERSSDGGATFQQVAGPKNATSAVDQTPGDGSYTYEAIAVAGGAQSSPGLPGTATSDSTAPGQPTSVSVTPQFINLKNEGNVPVVVDLPSGSAPSDTVTVTLSDGTNSATGTASGGSGSVGVNVDASKLSDGPISVSATTSDSLGNTSQPIDGSSVQKDTTPPGDPVIPVLSEITQQNEKSYQFQVGLTNPTSLTDTVHATFQDDQGNSVSGTGSGVDGNVQMQDLTDLADGTDIQVTAWVTDAAGNQSDKVQTTVAKDTTGPTAPTDFGVPAGPDNPAGVVTPQSASAVTITASFAQAPGADDTIVVFANHHRVASVSGDGQTTDFSFGPLDFSGLPAGTYKLGMMQTDGAGNETWTPGQFTVDTGATNPTGVGVPAGPNNPAGYVNAATQTAATIVATFAAPTDPADQIALSVGGLDLGTQAGGSDSVSWTGDLSSLPDGTLQILGTITDPNGVTTTFSGSLIKDTTPPPAPAVAGVVGPPPNVITPANASCVNVAVAFNQAPDPSDTVTATLSDGSNSAQGSAQAGNGQVTVGCIDASSLAAGPVSVTVTVTDLAGNSVTFTGTPAAKIACHHDQG